MIEIKRCGGQERRQSSDGTTWLTSNLDEKKLSFFLLLEMVQHSGGVFFFVAQIHPPREECQIPTHTPFRLFRLALCLLPHNTQTVHGNIHPRIQEISFYAWNGPNGSLKTILDAGR